MEHAQKIAIIDTLAASLLFSTVQNRLLIRGYLLQQRLDRIVSSLTIDGTGNTFSRNFIELLNTRGLLEHLPAIINLAIAIEDYEPLKQKLSQIQL